MTLTLYTAPYSTATLTEAALNALALPYERIILDIDGGDTRTPAFIAINPNGRVPVLAHEGAILWESAAILMHLGETFGVARGLYPAPGMARAHAMKWIIWGSATLSEAAGRLAGALSPDQPGAVQSGSVDYDADARDKSAIRTRAVADLEFLLNILNQALAADDFLIGEYSLADVHLAGIVGWISAMSTAPASYPAIMAWLARCEARAQA